METREDRRWASDLASWIFENAYYPALTKNLGEDLCRLASCIYFKNEDDDEPFYSRAYDREYAYGLSNNASKHTWQVRYIQILFDLFVQNKL